MHEPAKHGSSDGNRTREVLIESQVTDNQHR